MVSSCWSSTRGSTSSVPVWRRPGEKSWPACRPLLSTPPSLVRKIFSTANPTHVQAKWKTNLSLIFLNLFFSIHECSYTNCSSSYCKYDSLESAGYWQSVKCIWFNVYDWFIPKAPRNIICNLSKKNVVVVIVMISVRGCLYNFYVENLYSQLKTVNQASKKIIILRTMYLYSVIKQYALQHLGEGGILT